MSRTNLYPLKFKPILKPTIWGGRKLKSKLGKTLGEIETCGESWEISSVANNISEVAEGPLVGEKLTDLIEEYKGDLVGGHVYAKFNNMFPLLIKFIDAKEKLSIQVHPDDELARERHNSFGKTEMWYVVDADDGASLISGFNKPTNKAEYLEKFNSGKLMDLLNNESAKKDDVFFLPAGRVHTIGQGLLIAEIQQTSDITYRIYDFDRVDKEGNKRDLHVQEALAAIDFNYYEDYKTIYNDTGIETNLVSCDYFVCNRLNVDEPLSKDYSRIDSCIILMVLEGGGDIKTFQGTYSYSTGDTYLIPACISEISISPYKYSKILEVHIPVLSQVAE